MLVHRIALVVVSMITLVPAVHADEVFRARLSSLPIDAVTAPTMTGTGTVSATLRGSTLVIAGDFKGLRSNASVAHLRRAQPGVRGPVAFDLTVSKADSGAIEATLALNANQVNDLRRGWFYIQINTEKNPDGQLRGWLLR